MRRFVASSIPVPGVAHRQYDVGAGDCVHLKCSARIVEFNLGQLDGQLAALGHRVTGVHGKIYADLSICPGSALTIPRVWDGEMNNSTSSPISRRYMRSRFFTRTYGTPTSRRIVANQVGRRAAGAAGSWHASCSSMTVHGRRHEIKEQTRLPPIEPSLDSRPSPCASGDCELLEGTFRDHGRRQTDGAQCG